MARNAILPTLTIAGVLFGELIGGAVVTETVFGRAGIGRVTEQAVANQDIPVLQGIVVLAALTFVVVNLVVDLLYPVLDPRLRSRRPARPRRGDTDPRGGRRMSAPVLPPEVARPPRDEASGTVVDPLARDAAALPDQPVRASTAARLFALGRRPSWTLVLAIAILAVAVLWAIVPGLFTAYDPVNGVPADKLQPPSGAHWFGTDAIGRDLYARVVYGAIHSLSGALIAVTVGLAAGTLIGVVAGAVGRSARRHPDAHRRRRCCRSRGCSWRCRSSSCWGSAP